MEDAPPDPPPPKPLKLSYYVQSRKRPTAAQTIITCIMIGWVPFLCGTLNGIIARDTHSQTIRSQHDWSGAMFLGIGLLLTGVGLASAVHVRHAGAIIGAGLVLLIQVSTTFCLAAM